MFDITVMSTAFEASEATRCSCCCTNQCDWSVDFRLWSYPWHPVLGMTWPQTNFVFHLVFV